jgi:class 3 adenylate cyclase/CHASE2 domain-containing sensor protein
VFNRGEENSHVIPHLKTLVVKKRGVSHSRGKAALGLVIGLAATVAVAAISLWSWPDELELKMLDQRHRMFPLVQNDPRVAVLVIDDNSLQQLGRWPWPRKTLADLITLCRKAGATQVALDIIMPEEQPIEFFLEGTTGVSRYEPPPQLAGTPAPRKIDNDAELVAALEKNPIVTLPFYIGSAEPLKTDQSVRELLEANPNLSFEQLYHAAQPGGNISIRDPEYYQLLQGFMRYKAIGYLNRFSVDLTDRPVNVSLYEISNFTPPIPDFARATANSGFVSVLADKDGHVRRIPLIARCGNRCYGQFAFVTLCKSLGLTLDRLDLSDPDFIRFRDHDLKIPIDQDGRMNIAWAKGWADANCISITNAAKIWDIEAKIAQNENQLRLIDELTFQLSTVPADLSGFDDPTRQKIEQMRSDLGRLGNRDELIAVNNDLRNQSREASEKLRNRLDGKIVLVGSITTGVPDFYITPMGGATPGVMVHRNILNTLLQWAFIHRPPRGLEIAMILALGLLMTGVASYFRPLVSGMTLGGLMALIFGLNFCLEFAHWHYWVAVVAPLAAVLAAFTAVTFYRQITERHAKRQITAKFKQYTSPALVDRIVHSGGTINFAGETRTITCFFSDLQGFTTVSEKLGPQKTVAILNIYLDRMTEVLDRYDATVNKFQGDGIFAFFGAPVAMPDHCRLACLAALDAQTELERLVRDQRVNQPDFPPLKMRIGMSAGEVVVGDCGSQRRFDYTAIGDTVNLASRLEGANKAFGTRTMICERIFNDVRRQIEARYLGKVRVVGKNISVGVYELLAQAPAIEKTIAHYRDVFQRGVEDFQNVRFDKAGEAFAECLAIRPDDKAAILYRDTIRELTSRPLPIDFDGSLELTSK